MFWREQEQAREPYRVPDDVYDLVFRLRGESLDIDHAWALAQALRAELRDEVCERIGVHGIRLAGSGNGWTRPGQADAQLPLSRRARLVIRVRLDDGDRVSAIRGRSLDLGSQRIEIGDCSVRKLSDMGTLYARAISSDAAISEQEFLEDVAARLEELDIVVSRMICGKAGCIRAGGATIFTRTLMIADLEPEESVRLQRRGIGDHRLLGCGLFVPHKGIDAVGTAQQ